MTLEDNLALAATVSCLICYVSPLVASIEFYRAGTTESAPSLPLVSTCTSSLFWLVYGILSVNAMLIRLNTFSLLLFATYLAIYVSYCPDRTRFYREARIVSSVSLIFFPCIAMLGRTDLHTAMLVMGVVCNCLTIGVYAAPLGTLMEIVQQKNTSSMSPPLVLANWFSAVIWSVYGVVVNDIFIMIPNGLGLALCTAQCALLLMYPRSVESLKKKTS